LGGQIWLQGGDLFWTVLLFSWLAAVIPVSHVFVFSAREHALEALQALGEGG
jgi:hypothetical protein